MQTAIGPAVSSQHAWIVQSSINQVSISIVGDRIDTNSQQWNFDRKTIIEST